MKKLDAVDHPAGPAPAGHAKADATQRVGRIASEHAEPHDADGNFARRRLDMLAPQALALLRRIERQLAMVEEHVQHDVFGHARGEIRIDDAHQSDRRQLGIIDEMIDAGAERENHLETRELAEKSRRRLPDAHVGDLGSIADALRPDANVARRR